MPRQFLAPPDDSCGLADVADVMTYIRSCRRQPTLNLRSEERAMEFIETASGSRRVKLKGGEASVPLAAPHTRPVIVLITFSLGETHVASRLDVQKEMFIDPLPVIWDVAYVREVARFISRSY
jgi:hypothetical protein